MTEHAVQPGRDAFEQVVGLLDYPMFVVTTRAGADRAGCLVGFTSQVSINPSRFLVGLSKRNHTYRVASDGALSAWAIPSPNAQPDVVVAAPDGSVWFTLPNAFRIGRISPDGTLKEFPVENAPLGLSVASDGGVWFGSPAAKRVGRLEPSKGKVSWKSVPETPIALAAGPDGVVWVVLGSGDRIAKLPAKG